MDKSHVLCGSGVCPVSPCANSHLATLFSLFKLENPHTENRTNQTGYSQSNLPGSEQVELQSSVSVSNPLFIACSDSSKCL